jgi:hypothetical protein
MRFGAAQSAEKLEYGGWNNLDASASMSRGTPSWRPSQARLALPPAGKPLRWCCPYPLARSCSPVSGSWSDPGPADPGLAHPNTGAGHGTRGTCGPSFCGKTVAVLQLRQFGMPARNPGTKPPLHLMLAVNVLGLLLLPFVAVYVATGKCRDLLRRGLTRPTDKAHG